MWLTFATAALAVTPVDGTRPVVRIEWRKERATVRVEPPPNQKVTPDAPARLTLAGADHRFDLASDGLLLAEGIAIPDLRGVTVDGTLDVGLCDLSGTVCRITSWQVSGTVPEGKRGAVSLHLQLPEKGGAAFGPDATDDPATAAFARATASGKAVMLDFSAVWCPPCNLLAAEVLHGERPPELEGYEVAVLDVDHPSSFALKDRYAVGGYPTVVVVDADGNERSRTVGYTDRASFLGWLAGAAGSTDGADLARPVAELDPVRAAALAWAQLQAGEEARAEALLERAEDGADTLAFHLARFGLHRAAVDLEWILAHAPEEAPTCLSTALEAEHLSPELVRRTVDLALRYAEGTGLADVLSAAASLEDAVRARTLNAAAVSVVRSAMKGEPLHDKGYVTWLAHLLEESGDPEAAVALLVSSVATWPEEPTFDLALAPLLKRIGRLDEALASAERAVALSWGDNRLRAVTTEAEILVALGRAAEAATLAQTELAAQPAPETGLDVRTHRYRTKLEAVVAPVTRQ